MYHRILVIVDTDAANSAAVAQGLALAREHDCELMFLAVVPEIVMPVADFPVRTLDVTDVLVREANKKALANLATASQMAYEAGVRNRSRRMDSHEGAAAVLEQARQMKCDLVVVESVGNNSVMRLLAGSLIPGLITLATIPVLVVRHGCTADGSCALVMPAATAQQEARP